jgi:hypothetical protein
VLGLLSSTILRGAVGVCGVLVACSKEGSRGVVLQSRGHDDEEEQRPEEKRHGRETEPSTCPLRILLLDT